MKIKKTKKRLNLSMIVLSVLGVVLMVLFAWLLFRAGDEPAKTDNQTNTQRTQASTGNASTAIDADPGNNEDEDEDDEPSQKQIPTEVDDYSADTEALVSITRSSVNGGSMTVGGLIYEFDADRCQVTVVNSQGVSSEASAEVTTANGNTGCVVNVALNGADQAYPYRINLRAYSDNQFIETTYTLEASQ